MSTFFKKSRIACIVLSGLLVIASLVGCAKNSQDGANPSAANPSNETTAKTIELAIASCCVTEDVTTKEIVPAFEKYWQEKTGEKVRILPTFAGSGTLTNNIIGGNEIQVALLSSELYAHKLQEQQLTATDWRTYPESGSVIKSTIVFLVREGNPKGINTFDDLAKPGVEIIHSSPDTSGGAQWAIYSIYGSALKESEVATGVKDEAKAFELLKAVEGNVIALPESATQAAAQFNAGQGDVLVTYENEALVEIANGGKFEIVVPKSSIETGWTIVKLDKNIKPEQAAVVDGFIEFLYGDEAQTAYAEYGYRSINDQITAQFDKYAEIELPFDLDYLGGVKQARAEIIDDLWKQTQQR